MAKTPVAPSPTTALFRENLKKAMRADREIASGEKLRKAAKVGQRSVARILAGQQSPTLDMVHKLAHAAGLEPWQMLVPEMEPGNPPITKQIDERQQELFRQFRVAAQELARYETGRGRHDPPRK